LIFELVGKVSIYGSVDGLFLKETQNNRFWPINFESFLKMPHLLQRKDSAW
jgi:hypothetical protein